MNSIIAFIEAVSKYVKTHEKLLLVFVAGILLWGLSGKIQEVISNHDSKQYDVAQAKLEAKIQEVQATAAENAKITEGWKELNAAMQAQNAALEQQNEQLRAGLKKQQQTDATLAPTELAGRIQTLAELPDKAVVPLPSGDFDVTNAGAVKIAQALELIPVQKVELANAEQEKQNVQKQLDYQVNAVVPGLNKQIGGLNEQITQANNVCDLKIKTVKDDAAKSKRKWFIAGFITGFIARHMLKP